MISATRDRTTPDRALRWLTVGAIGAMAAACASVEPSTTTLATAAGAPSPIPHYDWHYQVDGREASLVFGVESSDDILMGMSCRAGSGKLNLFAIVDTPSEIHLESGGDTERFTAVAETSELHDGHILSAQAPTDAPVFQRFRRLGWIASLHDGRRDLYVAHPKTAPDIDRFFAGCD